VNLPGRARGHEEHQEEPGRAWAESGRARAHGLRRGMAGILEPLVDQQISVVTNDGRLFVGVLRGFDQTANVVLSDCQERVFDTEKGVEQVVLGLYVIRGDNIAVVGEVDEEIDSRIDLSNIRAAPLKPVVH